MTPEQKQFIQGLTQLTRKTGIKIVANCPTFLIEIPIHDNAGYAARHNGTDVEWVTPSDTYTWNKRRHEIEN